MRVLRALLACGYGRYLLDVSLRRRRFEGIPVLAARLQRDPFRPHATVNDPSWLLANGVAARADLHDLIESPLGADTSIVIDLRWRDLTSVGAYSKRRISNYEYANILALEYAFDQVPIEDQLLYDFHRMLVLLIALYGQPLSATDGDPSVPSSPSTGQSRDDATRIQACSATRPCGVPWSYTPKTGQKHSSANMAGR